MNNHYISAYGKYLNNKYDSLFDTLLHNFFWEKLNIDLYKIPIDKEALVGFEVLYFTQGSKKQFVCTITKEVIFEVGIEIPKFEFDGKFKQGKLYYEEYWRNKL